MGTVLVTGGAGFIGSHLCEHLLAQGRDVISIDDYSSGSLRNLTKVRAHPRFEAISHDVTVPIPVMAAEIYNLACRLRRRAIRPTRLGPRETCVEGALNALARAVEARGRILQASTSEVYGDPLEHPQSEGYRGNVSITGPRACYNEGKRCAETLFIDHHRVHGLSVKIARIFNTYGPRMRCDDGRVVSNFIVQCLRGDAITIFGDGQQTRSFCYVDDMVSGLVALMDTRPDFIGPVNLGTSDERRIIELAEDIIDITGRRVPLVFKEAPADDPVRRKPALTLACEVLRWEPKISLREGLTRTIEYFDRLLRENACLKGGSSEAVKYSA